MKSFLKDKLEFDMACNLDWSRHICLYDDHINSTIKKEMSHLINYHHILNQQILGEEIESELWDTLPIYQFEALHHDNYLKTMGILELEEDYFFIENENAIGRHYSIENILYDLLLHSQHHRAKIAHIFKQLNLPSKSHSFLLYKKEL